MTTVCFVTEPGTDPSTRLLSYETARGALSPYSLSYPYANALTIETVSLGAAIALLDDLTWYLRRSVSDVILREPSIDAEEWLSSSLARAVREEECSPEETASLLKVYGVAENTLLDPMYAERRADGLVPAYDLREVEDTVIVRIAASEFGG